MEDMFLFFFSVIFILFFIIGFDVNETNLKQLSVNVDNMLEIFILASSAFVYLGVVRRLKWMKTQKHRA